MSVDVLVTPAHALPYVPVTKPSLIPDAAFAAIEAAEFAGGPPAEVAARYRTLANSSTGAVRAGALLRLGRVLRKSHDFDRALAAYRQLAALEAEHIDTLPAELAGLDGQRLTYRATGRLDEEQRAAAAIRQGLDSGRWLLPRGMAEFYRDEVTKTPRPDRWLLAETLSQTWRETDGKWPARGQRMVGGDGRGVLVLWRAGNNRTIALAAFVSDFFEWPAAGTLGWRLTDPDGRLLTGLAPATPGAVARIVGNNSDNPWTLQGWRASGGAARSNSNRTLMLALLSAVLVVVWGATYFMGRAIRREADVARLQSDFVAAVSHEFRSPLTTVRQMAEMLELDRVPGHERRQQYYRILAAEAARLQRLVETLLNFGRMEAGAERYRFTDVDLAALVGDVVREFEPRARECDVRIELHQPEEGVDVSADTNALSIAVRNLLDNAVKYSPHSSTVHVHCRKSDGRASVAVADQGPGIPRAEQQAIFRKFFRGRSAIEANVKGTGVGLSMVQHIVSAHGGEVRLDSAVARGSTFTIALPLARGLET